MSRRCRAGLLARGSASIGLTNPPSGSKCNCVKRGLIKPEACIEPLIYGSNILTDPGFELTPQDSHSSGEDFPAATGLFGTNGGFYWEDGINATQIPGALKWGIRFNQLGASSSRTSIQRQPHLSESIPRSGDWCVLTGDDDGDIANNYLIPSLLVLCDHVTGGMDSPGDPYIMTARVEQGDEVELTQWIRCDNITDAPRSDLYVWFVDEDLQFTGDDISDQALATSYQEHNLITTVPAGSKYMMAEYGWFNPSAGTVSQQIRQDDLELRITEA